MVLPATSYRDWLLKLALILFGWVSKISLSLADMPQAAQPQQERKGKLSYTVCSKSTGAKVEVLLKGKAFRVVKCGNGPDGFWVGKLRACMLHKRKHIGLKWLEVEKRCVLPWTSVSC